MSTASPPLSLYVHIPWCVRKCPYCDFNSHESNNVDEAGYLTALSRDLQEDLQYVQDRTVQSIFIGGGTPSLFSAEAIGNLLEDISARLTLADDIEITMEANPGTFEQERFRGFREAGVNRLSIGIQSFADAQLKAIGRIHGGDESHRAIDIAHQAGFDNINIDLMYALPDQSLELAVEDVTIACDKGVQHISHYQLTIEPNTYFHKFPPVQPDDDRRWAIQNACQRVLAVNGYAQYEVSAYATPGKRSRHNLNYGRFGDYLGIGAGAHGKLTSADGKVTRRWKRRQPLDYMRGAMANDAASGGEVIEQDQLVFEFLLNALRLKGGVALETFEACTGLDRQSLIDHCCEVDAELLSITESEIRTTAKGFNFLNEVLEGLLPE